MPESRLDTTQEAVHALVRAALPPQGCWSDDEYLWLTDRSLRLVEFTDGHLEELPMPTRVHQNIIGFLYRLLHAWLTPRGGIVVMASLRMRVREGKFREPDLMALRRREDPRNQNRFWLGADLAAEVVSADDPVRDWVTKRADYAEASVPEYWIVDPQTECVTVLTLDGDAYVEQGVFGRGDGAASKVLDGLVVDVGALFDDAQM